MLRSVIIATGSCVPEVVVRNKAFEHHEFFEADGTKLYKSSKSIIEKFRDITGIEERRYARPDQCTSDLGFLAAHAALESGGIDKESIDYIIVAHNFGDIAPHSNRSDMVPSLASRVKAKLRIANPDCVAYDIAFGCPGWIEAMIQADSFIRLGMAKRCLVVGAETLSRIIDPFDRDSMIYSDGSGAVIVEAQEGEKGVLAHKTQTYAAEHAHLLRMDQSNAEFSPDKSDRYLKMNGRKVYEFALSYVPLVIRDATAKAGVTLKEISKILIHQANDKMDAAILERVFKLCGENDIPEGIMPMTIGWLGNSSVATVPTLLDLMMKGKMPGHALREGDLALMASVGAGMNINALVYRC